MKDESVTPEPHRDSRPHFWQPKVFSQICKTFRHALWAGVAVFGIYNLPPVLEVIAGKETALSLIASFLINTGTGKSIGAAWIVAIAAMIVAYRERRLRKSTVERLATRIREFEKIADPGRTTSGLTIRGDTRPGDH